MKHVILITGASSGFGALTARALAQAGHTVYASMLDVQGENAPQVAELGKYAQAHRVDLRAVELDVLSQTSVDKAVATVLDAEGRLDVLVHNAGHMVYGPAEAFTPEQLAHLYDVNVLGTQRINRAALPAMRQRGEGLLVWVSSSSIFGGIPPLLGPYFAAKAGMDALAATYSRELTRWGIETSIIVPGAFTKGTDHFANAGKPEDQARAAEYEAGAFQGFGEQVQKGLAATVPEDADVGLVGKAIVDVVNAPCGKRPYRVNVDLASDGSAVVHPVLDRVREEFLRRIGLADLLTVHA